jgi:hypothetical protein
MVTFLRPQRKPRQSARPGTTSISFSRDELADLAHLLAVGQAVLQKKSPAIPRLKAALTRLGLTPPKGL